jgi:hypothetical protein
LAATIKGAFILDSKRIFRRITRSRQGTSAILLLIFLFLGVTMQPLFGKEVSSPEQTEEITESFYVEEPERKDPFVAGLLSWSWSGLGQFYTQEYTYGSLFLLADIVQKGVLVWMIFYYSDKYTSDDDEIVKWQDIEKKDKGIIIGYIFSMLFVKVLCVVNAVDSAEKYNREIFFPYWKHRSQVRLSLDVDDNRIQVGLSRSF